MTSSPSLEPTTVIAAAPPTSTHNPTPTPIATSIIVPGWLTYENDFLGYRFSYPPEARIRILGVTGYPAEDAPENMTFEEFMKHLESIYPDDLCVTVSYKNGFVVVRPHDEAGGQYTGPCGVTGVGDYNIENWEEIIIIDGQPHTASAHRLTGQQGRWRGEFYLLRDINENLYIDFGGYEGTEEEFNEVLETLRRIVESLRF